MHKRCIRCNKMYWEFDNLSYNHLCPQCRKDKKFWTFLFNDKKGATLSGWTEVALFSILFLTAMGFLIVGMNSNYNKNFDATIGFSSTNITPFVNYQNQLQNATASGEAQTGLLGLSVTSTWTMILTGLNLVWNFLSGGWIEHAIGLLMLGESGHMLAIILRLIYMLSIGFIAIKLITKVRA